MKFLQWKHNFSGGFIQLQCRLVLVWNLMTFPNKMISRVYSVVHVEVVHIFVPQSCPVSVVIDFRSASMSQIRENYVLKSLETVKLVMPFLCIIPLGHWWQDSRRNLTLSWQLSMFPLYLSRFLPREAEGLGGQKCKYNRKAPELPFQSVRSWQ